MAYSHEFCYNKFNMNLPEHIPPVTKRPRPAVLIMLDGWGVAPDGDGNAITRANTPVTDMLTQRYPTVTLRASGEAVGLMWGEMGNSEVGHITAGAGAVHYQSMPRIERDITSGEFFENPVFLKAIEHARTSGGTLHLIGIISTGKVHGFDGHCYALLELAKKHKLKNVAVHAILDGRDTLYNSGVDFLSSLEKKISDLGVGAIASVSGRFYAMDRDNRWDRIQKAYQAMALGRSSSMTENVIDAVLKSYVKEVYDEEFVPTVMTKKGEPVATIKSGDAVIFFNFRPDRARELTKAFVLPSFDAFEREYIQNLEFVTMTEYEKGLPVEVAFAPTLVHNGLSEVLANAGLVQLHIAETEKYAHVTFFFNGTREDPFLHEDRAIIPSPHVESYDSVPEMSAREITDRVIKEIKTDNYDVIIMNFANPDMVAHTGNFEATVKAVECVDECVGKIVNEVLKRDGLVLITADHGNAEEVKNLQTGDMDKEHSTNPVPFWIIQKRLEGRSGLAGDIPNGDLSLVPPVGMLADVAPSMLKLMGITPPSEMTGTALIE